MADNLATISVDRINKAVNNAVRLSQLNQLSEMHEKSSTGSTTVSKSTVQGKSFIASTSKAPTQGAAAKNDHVFIKPSSGVPKKRSDGASGARATSALRSPTQPSASLPNVTLPTLTPGPMVSTVTQVGLSTSVRPSVSTSSSAPTLSPPTILSGPIVNTVAPMGLSSPIIRPSIGPLSNSATLSSPTITAQEGVTLQVQMPVVQAIPPGSQIINSYVPQAGSPVITLGKALRLVPIPPGKSPRVAASPQTMHAVQSLNIPTTSQEVQIVSARPLSSPGASPVSQTFTMVSAAGPMPPQVSVTPSCSIDAPDLLAAATQAAVPHLVTRYPPQKPVRTVLVQGIENSKASPTHTKSVKMTNDHVQSAVSSEGTPGVITIEPSSPTVQQGEQDDGTTGPKKRKTVYAILVNQDCTTTPSKGQLEHLMTEFEAYHPADEAKPTDVSSTFSGYFCPECNRVNPEECGVHTVITEIVNDSPVISRARATIPACLRINPQGVGSIEAAVRIKKYTKFGPLIGVKTEGTVMAQTPYLWKVFASQTEWLDCSDEEQSNWMRFVRQATLSVEQNLIAYLVEENIYFMTLEDIKPNTELRYWYSEDYAKHIGKSLHPGGGFTCLPCLKLFDSLHALNQHCRYSHADTSKRKFKCTLCARTFSSSSKCKTHLLSHTGQKPHRCQYCPKSFSDQSNLRMHLLIHSDVRKFECTVCKRMFKQKAHLTSHMLTHTGEKNMECEFCGKLFARRSDLRQHKLQHTKEQIHECDHPGCKKVFYKLQNLKKHHKIHVGVRDFACQKCQKTFTSAYHLKRHVNNRRDCCPKTVEQPLT